LTPIEGFTDPDRLVSTVARHVQRQQFAEQSDYDQRGQKGVHPSEMASDHWCPRATYYRLTGTPAEVQPHSLAMEITFATGTDIGVKWQNWFWDLGTLRGLFRCHQCNLLFEAVSPHECPRCEFGRDLLEYAEVPLNNDEYMIVGSADGDVYRPERDAWTLVEFKSMNANGIRMEAPKLVEQYSYEHVDEEGKRHTGVDWDQLWKGIRIPFASHLRQGMLYCFCLGRKEIVFIYEAKFLTTWPKEFEIRFNPVLIEDRLEGCLVVRDGIDKNRPPKRPIWAEPKHRACTYCAFKSTCWRSDANTRRH
jgi:hypothetical protein